MPQLRKKIHTYYKRFKKFRKREIFPWIASGALVVLVIFMLFSLQRAHTRYADMRMYQYSLDTLVRDIYISQQDILYQLAFLEVASQSEFEILRLQTEESLLEARDALESTRTALEDRIVNQSAQLRNVARSWSQRVPLIECTFGRQEETGLTSFSTIRGAGTLFRLEEGNTLLTNRHLLEDDERILETCSVSFLDSEDVFTFSTSSLRNGDVKDGDIGKVSLEEAPSLFTSRVARTRDMCTEPALIGDQIVILGYPSIGAENSVTVTEGIISGYENNFYITSAKVERGNSGGAAILVRENCYLGIPTFTASGRAESLARILDVHMVY